METLVENFSKRNDFNSLLDLFIHLDEVGEFLIHKQILFLEGERERKRNRIFANFGRKFFRIIKYNFDFLLVKRYIGKKIYRKMISKMIRRNIVSFYISAGCIINSRT